MNRTADAGPAIATGVVVGETPPAGLARSLRLPTADRAAAAWQVRNQFAAEEAALHHLWHTAWA